MMRKAAPCRPVGNPDPPGAQPETNIRRPGAVHIAGATVQLKRFGPRCPG